MPSSTATPSHPPATGGPVARQTFKSIRAPSAIGAMLDWIFARHCLITVNAGPDDAAYSSLILEVVTHKGYIVLDELAPAEGRASIRMNPRIGVKARVDGIDIRFFSRVAAAGALDGVEFYKVPFPETLQHTQQRDYFRAGVPLQTCIPLTISHPELGTACGELRDISIGGFSAVLFEGDVHEVVNHNRMTRCCIALPSGRQVHAQISICYATHLPNNKGAKVGARFHAISHRDLHRIEKLVSQLDRHVSKKQIKR